jgi:hypothetical protein
MVLFECEKCKEKLCNTADSGGDDIVQFTIICVCGHKNRTEFVGYPKLAGVDLYYFEFTDEFQITCKRR